MQYTMAPPTLSNINITNVGLPSGYGYYYSYHIYVKTEAGWENVGTRHYGLKYRTKSADLSGYLPDADGEYKVRVEQVGMRAAHIDSIELSLDGRKLQPVSATDGQPVGPKGLDTALGAMRRAAMAQAGWSSRLRSC